MTIRAYREESDPMPSDDISEGAPRASILQHWRADLPASLVVFLVALPLCMGIALASGAPIATGLVTGIIGGLVVGLFSGAPLQVSGPAAGLTVICAQVIGDYGLAAMGIVVMFAGAFQLMAGIFRLGQWFRAVSPAVIYGMLSGIGVLIVSSQLHVMVDDRPRENGVQNIVSIPESLLKGLPWPSWQSAEVRAARTEYLQAFGDLHERQDEIEREVARTVTLHGSKQLHEWEQDHLADFVPLEKSLLADLRSTMLACQASPALAGNGKRAKRLQESLATAETALAQALEDLENRKLSTVEQSQSRSLAALSQVLGRLKNHDWAAKVGLLSILVILGWNYAARGMLRLVPAPLLAVLVATVLTWMLALPVLFVEVPDSLVHGLTFPSWTVFEDVSYRVLVVAGLMMAVIASAETLLCATALDQMHTGPRTRYDRELGAQGIGNMLCGLVGALPMTGVIVRSAANVQAGARSRLSTILHGGLLLLFVLVLTPLLRMIPTAALAGILVYTGCKLIDVKSFLRLWRENRSEAAIFAVTLVVIVVEDLLVGVVTGVILSAIKLLVTFSHLRVDVDRQNDERGRKQTVMALSGAATFLRLPLLAARLDQVPPGTRLRVDFEQLSYIDHACLELLTNWARQHAATGGTLEIDWESLQARFKSVNGRKPPAIDEHEPDELRSETAA